MRRRALAMLVLALLLAAVPTAAQAKGASAATISGGGPGGLPGGPIALKGDGGEDLVRQSVWPYAAGGPVTFMATGLKVLDGTTKGGWYRAGDNLRQQLVTLGLPDRQPLATPRPASPSVATPTPASAPSPAIWPWVAAGMGVLLLAVVAGALFLRRRSSPGTAPAR
jgi:hypothetical protein